MKKIFAMALLAVATIAGSASAKGWYAGGNVGYLHEGSSTSNHMTNSVSILPEVGYNFNNQWALGGTAGYNFVHDCDTHQSLNLFTINPYVRYSYFRTKNNLVQLFVDGGAGVGLGWTDYQHGSSKTAVTWNVGFRPGVAINVTKNFSVVAHIGFAGYEGVNNHARVAGKHSKGGLSFDTNDLNLGFYYNF